jgi:non-lysosomal glucosylceramidase
LKSIMKRRDFIKTTGLGAALGLMPFRAGADETGPVDTEERRRRLAELMDEHRLFDRGGRRVYRGEHLDAISLPIGGIAAGPIQINGQARRHIWQIFRNYQAVEIPNSFFAVRAQAGDAAPVTRVLQTVAAGSFAPMASLAFSGEYPFGWFAFEEPALPVRVGLEVFSPLIPLNVKDSGIPCGIFNLTAENPGRAPVKVSFLATQQNPIGYRLPNPIEGHRSKTYGGNVNRVLRDPNGVVVHLSSTRTKDDPTYGDLALATPEADAKATANWASGFDFEEAAACEPTPAGETATAALAVPFVLQPGEKRTVTFVLAWHFLNTGFHADRPHRGNMYENWWPDALSVARDVIRRLATLTEQTRRYHETLYKTNLPHWLLDRISSQVAILGSMTCNWAKDGFFYAFEGCNQGGGCCDGNATHVWGYPQAHARLFPEIARRMREQVFAHMKPDGMIPVRFTHNFPAFDGICHEITAALREQQTHPDPAWLAGQWTAIQKALDYMIARWDPDGNGMLSGPQHAMDGDHGGTTSWLGSTYLCALAAAAAMARRQNDAAAAERYGRILEAGRANQDKALFNGEYYIQAPDPEPRQDYLTGCYIDQMLGQWGALQVNLGWLYPPEHVRSAMASLFRYNFRVDFHNFTQAPRTFCAPDDAGKIQCTWPKGGKPLAPHAIQYANEVMSGFEYCAACLMIQCGLVREGFTVLCAAADRYDGRLRYTPQTQDPYRAGDYANWGYTGNPFGDDECGKFYARAMAIWGVLIACQGFRYDAPTASIGFAPVWKPDDHVSFFTGAEGWGLFTQKRSGGAQENTLDVALGRLTLRELSLGTIPGQAMHRAAVERIGVDRTSQTLSAETVLAGDVLSIHLREPVTLNAGERIGISIRAARV